MPSSGIRFKRIPAITIDQPLHAAYEKFIEITSHLSGEMSSDQTYRTIEASLETDGQAL